MKPKEILIKGGTLVTIDSDNRILTGDLLIDGGRIVSIATSIQPRLETFVIDARGRIILPG
ncbi:MAG: hypothetical protein RIR52_2109, partial [Acidobacteriota bacterium]